MMRLKELVLQACPDYRDLLAIPDRWIKGVQCDSRKVEKDFLFVAIRGKEKNGNEFVEEALSRGAVAVVTDQAGKSDQRAAPFILVPECRLAMANLAAVFYGRPSLAMKVIGITGTNGKTTTAYLIEHLVRMENKKVGVIGTVNYRFDGHEIPAAETTPGPLKIQELLAQMRDAGCEYAVMEISSHALDQHRVTGVDFAAALFTNLTQDHLDYHKTLEAYFECKSRLFSGLGVDNISVLNADDPWTERLKKKTRSRIVTFGIETPSDFRATEIEKRQEATHFMLETNEEKFSVRSPLIGLHNVYNALGALATLSCLGFDLKKSVSSLSSFPGVPGRLEAVSAGQNFLVFVDFAHTPDGLENVLSSLRPYKKNRLITVFGCGGDRDKGKRPKMAKIASDHSDFVYVTSDNPRSEDPKQIAQEVCQGFPSHFKNYAVVLDRKKAIRQALLSAHADDIVLLAGKGHETTQVLASQVIPFSDRKEAEQVLNGH